MSRKVECPSCKADVPIPDDGSPPEVATYNVTEKLDEFGKRLETVEKAHPAPEDASTASASAPEPSTLLEAMGG